MQIQGLSEDKVPLKYRLKMGTILGGALMLSLTLNVGLITNRPERIVVKTETKVVTQRVEPENQVLLRTAKVVRAWRAENGAPSGNYDLVDQDGNMRLVQFCEPIPSWTYGDELADLKFLVEKECSIFTGARVIKLNPNAYWRREDWLSKSE